MLLDLDPAPGNYAATLLWALTWRQHEGWNYWKVEKKINPKLSLRKCNCAVESTSLESASPLDAMLCEIVNILVYNSIKLESCLCFIAHLWLQECKSSEVLHLYFLFVQNFSETCVSSNFSWIYNCISATYQLDHEEDGSRNSISRYWQPWHFEVITPLQSLTDIHPAHSPDVP